MASPVSLLRARLRELGVQAYFLPHNDAHNNEYLSSYDMRMPYLCGFTGSNGQLLITQEQAFLWTDGRYWLAAEKQLYPEWTLMKLTEGVPRYFEWVEKNVEKGSVIGYDPTLIPAESVKLRKEYFEKRGLTFKGLDTNPINEIWSERPPLCKDPVFQHLDIYAGENFQQKLAKVLAEMKESLLFTNTLDEVAWLLNLRGTDIEFNPVFFSHLLIEKAEVPKVHLFIDSSKLVNVHEYIQACGIIVHEYCEIYDFLQSIEANVQVDASKCSESIYSKIKHPVSKSSVITEIKAIKTAREIEGFRASHIRDAVAVCKYFAWLTKELKDGVTWTEYSAASKLEAFRREEQLNQGLSFATISSVGENAAVIHYKPQPATAKPITTSEIYLLDSGGHYLDGTIDTTRTVHFGSPSDWEKECYTRVLLGNLDLERMMWPDSWGISGADLDIMARRRLWQRGLDYAHGTGHGVGYFLNVHEGPQGISRARTTILKPGMDVTNEPGYYEAGAFGIRIENVMFVTSHPTIDNFMFFENVTMVPYENCLIKIELLDKRDIEFINNYHRKIWDTLSPILESRSDLLTLEWLKQKVAPIS